jgi:hypothetical protein
MSLVSGTTLVGVTATALEVVQDVDASPASALWAHNAGAVVVWVGDADVTVGTGIPLNPGDTIELQNVMSDSQLYGIADSSCQVNVMQVGV